MGIREPASCRLLGVTHILPFSRDIIFWLGVGAAIQRFPISFSNSDRSCPRSQGPSAGVTTIAMYPRPMTSLGAMDGKSVDTGGPPVSYTLARATFVTWLQRPYPNRGVILMLWVSGCRCQLGPYVPTVPDDSGYSLSLIFCPLSKRS